MCAVSKLQLCLFQTVHFEIEFTFKMRFSLFPALSLTFSKQVINEVEINTITMFTSLVFGLWAIVATQTETAEARSNYVLNTVCAFRGGIC